MAWVDVTNALYAKTPMQDSLTGYQFSEIERLAMRLEARKNQPIGKAINTANTLGTGYTGTETFQPQDRQPVIAKEFSEQWLPLLYFYEKVFPIRTTKVLNPQIGIQTTDGYNRSVRPWTPETGVLQNPNFEVEVVSDYMVKILGFENDASFLTRYISLNFGLPSSELYNKEMIEKLVLPKSFNQMLWTSRKSATRLAGAGSNYLGWDGLPELILQGRASNPHTVYDFNGKKIHPDDVNKIIHDQVEKGFVGYRTGDANTKDATLLMNLRGIVGTKEIQYLRAYVQQAYMNVNNRRDNVGFAFNNRIYTDFGDYLVTPDHHLDRNVFADSTATVPVAASPSTCTILQPTRVTVSAVATGGAAPATSYFLQHTNHGVAYFYWVSLIGPTGESIATAADENGAGGVTIASGQVARIEIQPNGISDVYAVRVWRGTSLTNGKAIWRDYPVATGATFVIYDADEIIPGTRPTLWFPTDPSEAATQLCRLLGYTQISMAMQQLIYRDALVCANVPILNNRKKIILGINAGDN